MRRSRWCLTASLALALALAGGPAAADPGPVAEQDGVRCELLQLQVAIGDQRGPLAGTLCAPPQASALQVLVHDATYDREYWDFPYAAPAYSYVAVANQAGFATFAIDRVGAGDSWRPSSELVSFEAQADTLHQVIQAARRGDLGRPFARVAVVGQGIGALVAYLEAGVNGDVDALVATGVAHGSDPGGLDRLRAALVPAIDDPAFGGGDLDAGYLTTVAGARGGLLHNAADADPEVIARDEELKSTTTAAELDSLNQEAVFAASTQVDVPVLVVVGARDPDACGEAAADCSSARALAEFESRFLGPEAHVEAMVLPDSGRAVGLGRDAREGYFAIADFLERRRL